MDKLTFEQIQDWTKPRDYEIVGRATSQEEYNTLAIQYEREHQQLVLSGLRTEIARRSGTKLPEPVTAPDASVDFSRLPLQLITTRNRIGELAKSKYLPPLFQYQTRTDFTHAWMVFAEVQAELEGHSINSSKNFIATDGPTFEKRYKRSKEISDSGYPVRFLMNGVKHIQASALDLNSVQKWLDTRAKSLGNGYLGPSDYPPIYGVSWGLWPDIITAKQNYDADNQLSTYADTVTEVADGVYLAPYIPDEVALSPELVTYDDVHRAVIRSGNTTKMASMAFTDLVRYAIPSQQTRGAIWPFFENPQSVRSGTFFLERGLLDDAIERKYESYNVQQAGQSTKVARAMEVVRDDVFRS
jgi:hypothetical protein